MSSIENLPMDIQLNITRKVASKSVFDLLNLKATCKTLYNIGGEEEVYSVVNVIDDVHLYDWMVNHTREEAQLDFEERMQESRNNEIILRDSIKMLENGVKNNKQNLENILENMKDAVKNGDHVCTYLSALLVLIQGCRDSRPTAINLLVQLQNEGCFTSCREKVYKYFNLMHIGLMERQEEALPPLCNSKSTCNGCKYTFEDLEIKWCTDEFDMHCEIVCPFCRIELELEWLCRKLFL